jgi:hypothetical protein
LRVKFGPSLLGIKANGSRYFIARGFLSPWAKSAMPAESVHDGDLWLVEERPDGFGGASPLGEMTGASTEPFEHWIAGGVTPPRTRSVEIRSQGTIQQARFRHGMWLAAIPVRGDGEQSFTVHFVDVDGLEIESREDEFEISRRRLR